MALSTKSYSGWDLTPRCAFHCVNHVTLCRIDPHMKDFEAAHKVPYVLQIAWDKCPNDRNQECGNVIFECLISVARMPQGWCMS